MHYYSAVHKTIFDAMKIASSMYNNELTALNEKRTEIKADSNLSSEEKREKILFLYGDSKLQELLILFALSYSTYLEASTNFTLSYIFNASNNQLENTLLAKFDLLSKLCPGFELSESEKQLIQYITKTRNNLVHHKPEFQSETGQSSKGTVEGYIYSLDFGTELFESLPRNIFQRLIERIDDHRIQWKLQIGLMELNLESH